MTDPAEHPPQQDKLWVTDKELVKLLGCGEKHGARLLQQFDADKASGFPPKKALFGDRRYLPAVRAYFDRLYIPKMVDRQERPYPRRVS